MKSFYNIELKTLKTTVKEAKEQNGFLRLVLDDTIFYPGGGGQPCDKGKISSVGFEADILEVFEEQGELIHEVKVLRGAISSNQSVELHLDVERRNALMRMHTGEHILFKSLQTVLPQILLSKIDLNVDESKLFVEGVGISWDVVFEAEKIANKVISDNKTISEKEYSKENALNLAGLRIKPERIPGNTVRVIEIENFDLSACRGIHAHKTADVGSVLVTGLSKNVKGFELRFATNASDSLFEYAKILRTVSAELKTNPMQVPDILESIQKELDDVKSRYRALAAKQTKHVKEDKIGSYTLVWNITQGVEKKQLLDGAVAACVDGKIVFFIDEIESKSSVILLAGPSSGIDAKLVLDKILKDFKGKGGGKQGMAMGSCSANPDDIVARLKEELVKLQ